MSGQIITFGEHAFDPHRDTELPAEAMEIGAMANATQEGRAGVTFIVNLPNRRRIIIRQTLRNLHGAVTAIVAKFGEPFMQHDAPSDREARLNLIVQSLTADLLAAKVRLGEPPEINLEAADAKYDREEAYRAALQFVRETALGAGWLHGDTDFARRFREIITVVEAALLDKSPA